MLFVLSMEKQKVGSFSFWLDLHHDFRFWAKIISNFCPFLLSIWDLWDECFEIRERCRFLFLFLSWSALLLHLRPSLTSDEFNKIHGLAELTLTQFMNFLIWILNDSFLMKKCTRFFSICWDKSQQNGKQAKHEKDSKRRSNPTIINPNDWLIYLWFQKVIILTFAALCFLSTKKAHFSFHKITC